MRQQTSTLKTKLKQNKRTCVLRFHRQTDRHPKSSCCLDVLLKPGGRAVPQLFRCLLTEVLSSVRPPHLPACRLLHQQGALPRPLQCVEVKFYLSRFLPPLLRAARWSRPVLSDCSFHTFAAGVSLFYAELCNFRLFAAFSPLFSPLFRVAVVLLFVWVKPLQQFGVMSLVTTV